jgi:hypothetical protein
MALSPHLDADGIEEIEALLEGLTRLDLSQLRRGLCPPLYQSRVRYQREAPGREEWQSAVRTWKLGTGDCEDLSCYLAANYRLVGEDARPAVKVISPWLKHVIVVRADGSIEDPSKRLGMGAAAGRVQAIGARPMRGLVAGVAGAVPRRAPARRERGW